MYRVGLPGSAGDVEGGSVETGGALASDASIDQSSPSDKAGSGRSGECSNREPLYLRANQVEMLISLSRSSSMQQSAFDASTRLQAAQQALSVAMRAHPSIQFGLEQFPGSADCGGATCCADSVAVLPAPHQASSIENQMACASGDAGCPIAGSDSPSHLALRRCGEYFANEGSAGRLSQFVLLVTDQDPACAGDASADASPCSLAVAEAAKLGGWNLGVQAFVVAVSNQARGTGCLGNVAAANASSFGGNSQFVAATNQQELHDGLDAIMVSAEASLCRFSLAHPPDNPDQLTVTLNHGRVPMNSGGQQAGWRFTDNSLIEIVVSGSYCEQLKSGQGDPAPTVTACWP
jgi:hypothetical protein